ncbi:CUB and sushi domain-containing protein 1-like [Oppia nitens]|uniref:CUB and sushi domain-containing protein 1-like n=1 Tax=Oppia nitens TaxID=1686743 RepID=UPI0023D99DDC|nr:CUB and sushi domain-containing protein 1-like [Oppia nitens]
MVSTIPTNNIYLFYNNFIILCLVSLISFQSGEAKSCPHPAIPLYAQVVISDEVNFTSGSTTTYKCDDGYELFGTAVRVCGNDGKWTGDLPYCAVNVAYGKPSNQSSTIRGGESRNANDGDITAIHENKYCTETKIESSPWWQVDLLQPYEIKVIRIVTRGCCGHQPLHDLEIRVGNSSTVQGNRLCSWFPGTLDDGMHKDLFCAIPITGRYVYIQMVGIEGSLSLCEVFVFTTKEFSSDRCGNAMEYQQLTPFNKTCYEFQTQRGGSFNDAESYCKARGGLVVNSVVDVSHNFLYYELERIKPKLKSKLVWLGARRDVDQHKGPSFHRSRASKWHWVSGQPVTNFLWAEDQPNNYNGQQNCIVLDGGRKWLWNDVTCDLDYLSWICQYRPSNCGSPDKNENTTIIDKDYRVGQTITYQCPVDSRLDGSAQRNCQSNGFWQNNAPTCQYVNCGSLTYIPHGRVEFVNNSRTTFNATARYTCDENYTLVGNETRVCLGNSTWSGTEPKCLYSWCPILTFIPNGAINITNRTENGLATYSCHKGHLIVGNNTRKCLLGGKWTDSEPVCKFVDCGVPIEVRNAKYRLLNGTTYYNSSVKYECDQNYTIDGNELRNCTEYANWSGTQPICKLIDCGKPFVPQGVKLLSDSFTVHSEVIFECEPGHKLVGGDVRHKCQSDGKWSGALPVCNAIECGRVQTILKGEVSYVNSTTYLNSQISYSCSSGYKLIGSKTRVCSDESRWSGSTPKCEEIRCVPPEIPKNSSVVYSGNDRSSSDSFKVGSTVQYRCSQGHIVQGQSLRTCESNGLWSGSPPICIYIDCGLPFPISHGKWLLNSNTTYYGSTVEYVCDQNFKLNGPGRRICLENGTWSSIPPLCDVVTCNKPETKDDKTIIEVNSYSVAAKAYYSCSYGLELVGEENRMCQPSGQWSGDIPYCRLVDCGRPPVIPNGRAYLVNGTTLFGSIVEYHCLPEFKLIGDSQHRKCMATGDWSGTIPRCLELAIANEIEKNRETQTVDHTFDPNFESSKAIGIGIAVGAGALLILIIIVSVICLKAKKPQPVKNTENVEVNRQPDKDTATVMSYSRLSLESEAAAAANNLANNGAIRHHPNGLVTFSPPSGHHNQPLYANTSAFRNHNNTNGSTVSVAIRSTQPQTASRFASINSNGNGTHGGNVGNGGHGGHGGHGLHGVHMQSHNV